MNSERRPDGRLNHIQEKVYEFADFTFDVREKLLVRDGLKVSMPPKTCDLLAVFLENDGRLLTKAELFEKVWGDAFVEEANLSHHVARLRKALGDGVGGRKFIETVPRRGYRFVAPAPESAGEIVEVTIREHVLTRVVEEDVNVPGAPAPERRLDDGRADSGRRGGLLFAFGAFAAVVFVAAAYLILNGRAPRGFQPSAVRRVTTNGRSTAARISPDGRYVLYIQRDGGERGIWLRQLATGSDMRITPPVPAVDVFGTLAFSPDGEHVLYSLRRQGEKVFTLYETPSLGGAPRKVLTNLVGAVSFSPDGKRLAFFRSSPADAADALMTASSTDGSDERVVALRERPNHFNGSLAWSPDGRSILCPAFDTEGGFHYEFIVVDVADGAMRSIKSRRWQSAEAVVWNPDGSGFFFLGQSENTAASQIWQVSYPSGEAREITNDASHYGSLSVTADGKSIVANKLDLEAHIWLTSPGAESEARQITFGDNNYDGLNGIGWLPDGRIAYHSKASGADAVWITDTDGRQSRKIAAGGGVAVSPDGRYIAFQGGENDALGLRRVEVEGLAVSRLTNGVDFTPAYSPDGKQIFFSRFQDQTNLWRMPSDGGGEPVVVTDEFRTTSSPAVSPDGKTLALAYGRPQRSDVAAGGIALLDLAGNRVVGTFAVPEFRFGSLYEQPTLQWTRDGAAIGFIVLKDGVSNLWAQPVAGGDRVQLTSFKDGRIFNFAFAPDGRRLALSRGNVTSDVVLLESAR